MDRFAPKARGMVNHFTVMPPSLKRWSRAIPAESAEALARVVATADLAERGLITVTSTKGMSSEEFFALIKAKPPTK